MTDFIRCERKDLNKMQGYILEDCIADSHWHPQLIKQGSILNVVHYNDYWIWLDYSWLGEVKLPRYKVKLG